MGDIGLEEYQLRVNQVLSQVDKIEQRVIEIDQFYVNNSKKLANTPRGGSASKEKDKDKERLVANGKKQDVTSKETIATKRMQELIRQFGTILNQISKHKFAWPFMDPVDVKGLGLNDYYEIIEKPMDFGTIKKKMDAKDGSGYKHVREIYSDVRLVFKNAMKYNDETNKFHVMAKTLLEKFEDKWRQFLPKVIEEERRYDDEEVEVQLNVQLAQEAAYAKMARDISNELFEADMHLEELRETLVQRCRKMSTEEKRQLGTALTRLSTDDLSRALEIVAQSNPGFIVNAEEVDLDIDAQSESTLWRLKFFVKDALQAQGKPLASTAADNNNNNEKCENNNNNVNNNSKRKREICDALAKTTKKKAKKLGS
ncbi:transcription factor GTE1 [Silene latifolia]|uniref:transcription factor GTE1 n=1 Tax=Silene latifolia TaxID=37657 RepID=UPI003D789C7A